MTSRLRLVSAALLLTLAMLGLAPAPALAEQPSRVVTALRRDGVFIHNRRDNDVDRAALVAVVDEAEQLGYKMAVVMPLDPLPELRSFVLRVQQGGEFDAVIGFGLEGEVEAEAGEQLDTELLSALRAVREADGTPEELSAMFLTELTTEPEATIPPAVWTIIRWTAYLLAGLVAAGVLETIWRSLSKRGKRGGPDGQPTA